MGIRTTARRPARAHGVLLLCLLAAAFTPLLTAGVRLAGLGVLPGLTQAVGMHHNEEVGDHEFLPALRLVSLISESQEPERLEEFLELSRSSYGLSADDLLATIEAAKIQAAELAATFLGKL